MTETMKIFSTENVALREENDNLMTIREEKNDSQGNGLLFVFTSSMQKILNICLIYPNKCLIMTKQLNPLTYPMNINQIKGGRGVC